jgi:hypothetical protein
MNFLLQHSVVIVIVILCTLIFILGLGVVSRYVIDHYFPGIHWLKPKYIINNLFHYQFPGKHFCSNREKLLLLVWEHNNNQTTATGTATGMFPHAQYESLYLNHRGEMHRLTSFSSPSYVKNCFWYFVNKLYFHCLCSPRVTRVMEYFFLGFPMMGLVGHLYHYSKILFQLFFRNEGGLGGLLNITLLWFGNDLSFMLRLYVIYGNLIFMKECYDELSVQFRKWSAVMGNELINATD